MRLQEGAVRRKAEGDAAAFVLGCMLYRSVTVIGLMARRSADSATGVALCACAEYGKPMYEYTPMQIKQAVTGYGKADKMQVQQMVKMMLNLPKIIRPDDAADAVAAALTHAASGRMKEQFLMK